jgi:hypothetical protein
MASVLLSYVDSDESVARALIKLLEGAGHSVHSAVAQETAFRSRVSADWVVVIWSDAALTSPYVYENALVALKRRKLVQVYVSGFETSALPAVFRAGTIIPSTDSEQTLRALRDNFTGEHHPQHLASLSGRRDSHVEFSNPPTREQAPKETTEPTKPHMVRGMVPPTPIKTTEPKRGEVQGIEAAEAALGAGALAWIRPPNWKAALEKEAGQLVHRAPDRMRVGVTWTYPDFVDS